MRHDINHLKFQRKSIQNGIVSWNEISLSALKRGEIFRVKNFDGEVLYDATEFKVTKEYYSDGPNMSLDAKPIGA